MKKWLIIPVMAFALACNSSSKPTVEEDAKAAKESDSIANAADAFLNDTTAQDTAKKEETTKK
jgi:hypothetical protein